MKRFLKSVLAILHKTNEPKAAAAPKRPSATPLLDVSSQVKAGYVIGCRKGGGSPI
jgi:hypothetical protein